MKTYISVTLSSCGAVLATAGINTPLAIHPGMIVNCLDFTPCAQGDTCVSIASREGITLDQFIAYNPALGSAGQCNQNLRWGLWYCKRAGAGPLPPPPPPPPSPTTNPVDPPPKKTQDAPKKTDSPKKTEAPPKETPPPKLTDSGDCGVPTRCRGVFAKAVGRASLSQSTWCAGYLATVNPETDPSKVAGMPNAVRMDCRPPAEVSKYCACWQLGLVT